MSPELDISEQVAESAALLNYITIDSREYEFTGSEFLFEPIGRRALDGASPLLFNVYLPRRYGKIARYYNQTLANEIALVDTHFSVLPVPAEYLAYGFCCDYQSLLNFIQFLIDKKINPKFVQIISGWHLMLRKNF